MKDMLFKLMNYQEKCHLMKSVQYLEVICENLDILVNSDLVKCFSFTSTIIKNNS